MRCDSLDNLSVFAAVVSRRSSPARWLLVCGGLLFAGIQTWAGGLSFDCVELPPLRIKGQIASAHTQGLEVLNDRFYVTARREDVLPKQALLLRVAAGGGDWDVWDITPKDAGNQLSALDHPGGFQSDGRCLWIPLAESKPKGRSIIRAFALSGLVRGRPLQAEREIPVKDHIGAVAVSQNKGLLFGASWDTERVYVWNLAGQLQQTLETSDLAKRGLGLTRDPTSRKGLAVQDWKLVEDQLFASGLRPTAGNAAPSRSQLLIFDQFLDPGFRQRSIILPKPRGIELAREGMAVSGGLVYFLPDDLGKSNRIFCGAGISASK